ncbi:MAG TPA: ABC transporter ATP-binding protein [Candidatus Limnocylindria bacterium]|nr:ABC transporter ATP-binding protein [Candidatus Limnocylindria bacterium]
MTANGLVVEARGLAKSYGARRVVDDVSFEVAAGECVGLLGPNGAGKTTTIKMVTCFLPPDAGALRVAGLPMEPRHHRAIKRRLGIVHQEDSLDPDLSVEKNLTIYASYFDVPAAAARRRAAELIDFAALAEHRRSRIRTLSGGMKRRLMLARALLNDPALLVLDEPTTGLDPQARRLVWERIRQLKTRGTTILLTTHYMEEAARLCDRLIIMDGGRIVAAGTTAELIARCVGDEVVEVRLADDADDHARFVAALAGGPWRVERAGQMVYVQLRGGDGDERLARALVGREFTRRCATLEDVFLTLTGHSLRD